MQQDLIQPDEVVQALGCTVERRDDGVPLAWRQENAQGVPQGRGRSHSPAERLLSRYHAIEPRVQAILASEIGL